MTNMEMGTPVKASVIIVMGVAGSGKTTIGELLAKLLHLPFFDADDFHPEANREKLADDLPLNDADREPWLELLVDRIRQWGGSSGAVLACSALKHSYRSQFRRAASDVSFIFLHGDPALIADRLHKRASQGDHIISDFESILRGQYRDLELPTDALRVDIDQTPEQIVNDIVAALSTQLPTTNN